MVSTSKNPTLPEAIALGLGVSALIWIAIILLYIQLRG